MVEKVQAAVRTGPGRTEIREYPMPDIPPDAGLLMIPFENFTHLTFDCYGTLIDWETGILAAVTPVLARRGVAAEAERERRAKIIAAEGEAQSAAKLGDAADIIGAHPIALQLRNLQVLSEIAVEKNSTIIFPSQFMDTVDSIKNFMAKEKV